MGTGKKTQFFQLFSTVFLATEKIKLIDIYGFLMIKRC